MQHADLLIHINETLGTHEQASLEKTLRQIDGVIEPRFPQETRHLLLVSYDPGQTNSHQLLSHVKAHHYTAQLVGL